MSAFKEEEMVVTPSPGETDPSSHQKSSDRKPMAVWLSERKRKVLKQLAASNGVTSPEMIRAILNLVLLNEVTSEHHMGALEKLAGFEGHPAVLAYRKEKEAQKVSKLRGYIEQLGLSQEAIVSTFGPNSELLDLSAPPKGSPTPNHSTHATAYHTPSPTPSTPRPPRPKPSLAKRLETMQKLGGIVTGRFNKSFYLQSGYKGRFEFSEDENGELVVDLDMEVIEPDARMLAALDEALTAAGL